MEQTNKPVYTIKVGAIDASVWENLDPVTNKKFYSVNFSKAYLDKDGNWKKTSSIDINDIPKTIIALDECYKFIVVKK